MSEPASSSPQRGSNRSNDGKSPEAFRTIGEVTKALGIRQHVLRYWEEQFPMLRPVKRSGGRRYYRPEDVRLIETIDRLVHREGYTLRGARQALEGVGRPPVPSGPGAEAVGDAVPVSYDIADRLRAIRSELSAALDG
jgi:DNA-binding transcriptional MerR regulator